MQAADFDAGLQQGLHNAYETGTQNYPVMCDASRHSAFVRHFNRKAPLPAAWHGPAASGAWAAATCIPHNPPDAAHHALNLHLHAHTSAPLPKSIHSTPQKQSSHPARTKLGLGFAFITVLALLRECFLTASRGECNGAASRQIQGAAIFAH
jgi:hypothetical protein